MFVLKRLSGHDVAEAIGQCHFSGLFLLHLVNSAEMHVICLLLIM